MRSMAVMAASICFIAACAIGSNLGYIELNVGSFSEMDSVLEQLEIGGLRPIHVFPPSAEAAGAAIVEILSVDPRTAVSQFDKISVFVGGKQMTQRASNRGAYESFLCIRDSNEPSLSKSSNFRDEGSPPTLADSLLLPVPVASFPVPSPANMFTANYLMGKVAVWLITPESESHDEDWTSYELDSVLVETVEACHFLWELATENNARLCWIYRESRAAGIHSFNIQDGVPIMINEPCDAYLYPNNQTPLSLCYPLASYCFGWLSQIQENFGYADKWDGAFGMVNSLRKDLQANWGIIAYVVRNVNQPSPRYFLDGFPAGASGFCVMSGTEHRDYMGPLMVSGYMTDASAVRLHERLSHEISHLFRAPDEYERQGGDCSGNSSCQDRFGYLQVPNANCQHCCEPCLYCVMKTSDYSGACPSTLAHLGWRDSDGDGVCDPIDPNNGGWQSIQNVNPGDLVRIYTLDMDFVNLISVTDDNMFRVSPTQSFAIWDGHNYDDQTCVTGQIYYVTINNGSPFTIRLNSSDPSISPVFTDISYSNGFLNWKLTESWAYVRCFIYDSQNNLVARPIWDKLYASNYPQSLPMMFLPQDQTYTARFYAWRPDGGKSQTINYTFNYQCTYCGDADGSGSVDISDAVYLVQYIFAGGPEPGDCQIPTGLGDANGDCTVDISDVAYIVQYAFAGGAQPHCGICQ